MEILDRIVKHTPGPWEVENEQIFAKVDIGKDDMSGGVLQPIYDVPLRPQLSVNDSGIVTMHICYESWRQFPSINFKEMQEANAHLITAAPELLDALEKIIFHTTPIPDKGSSYVTNTVLSKARKSIKKALGIDDE